MPKPNGSTYSDMLIEHFEFGSCNRHTNIRDSVVQLRSSDAERNWLSNALPGRYRSMLALKRAVSELNKSGRMDHHLLI